MAGGDTGVRGAAERGLELRLTGVAERFPDCGDPELRDGAVLEPAEGMDSDELSAGANV